MESSRVPPNLDPIHIERCLANANELMRRVYMAQGLDGQLRTKPRQDASHDRPDVVKVGAARLFVGGMQ
jgi:hypothetical protein